MQRKNHCQTRRRMGAAAALALLLSATAAHPAERIVYSTNIAPFFHGPADYTPGAVNALLLLAARRSDATLEIQALPFKRMYALLDSHPGTLAVMWRLPEVEDTRHWLARILREQLVVLVRTDGTVRAETLDAARQLRIGVVLGGPAEMVARRLGFAHIETAATAESNAHKLALGRIEAWVAFRSVAAVTQRRIGLDAGAFRSGIALQEVDLYLTSGLSSEPRDLARWRDVFLQLRRSGAQQGLLRQYGLSMGASHEKSPAPDAVSRP
jgi:polar amino acid transport system substrate-binding protein